MRGEVHVVGAGLAGLAASVRLAERGWRVVLHEAADHAGGRARSYHDPVVGCRVDNGNHLILAGNDQTHAYLAAVGARDALVGPAEPGFAFLDLATGARFAMRPNPGRLPWWPLVAARRLPGSRAADYLAALRLRGAPTLTVAEALAGHALYERLWRPLAIAVLNTPPEEAQARLLWAVLAQVFGRGGAAAAPRFAPVGLSESLVDPALAWLAKAGVEIRFGARLRAVTRADDRVARLGFTGGEVQLGENDQVVLALPGPVASELVPGLDAPDDWRAIVNVHFADAGGHGLPPLLGLIGGTAEWLFAKPGHLSVTISAADHLRDLPTEELIRRTWADVARALGQPGTPPPAARLIREKRATIAATVAQAARRPPPLGPWRNMVIAGDWTDTGLPSTIEGAVLSGHRAADSLGSP
jgi:squalene-associated FAD-dependent desaturase